MKCKCCCNNKTEQTEIKEAESDQVEQSKNLDDVSKEPQPPKKKIFLCGIRYL